MIILDTNVISEMMRALPEQRVMDWQDRQEINAVFLTAISKAELQYGIAVMPVGRRRTLLADSLQATLTEDFGGRILPFDGEAAEAYADIRANRRAIGRPIKEMDAQIAAIAAVQGAKIATRNVKDFDDCGIAILNPWLS
ncbi:type II toxin-antitoxin system VapC family toxin [Jiella sonneratiae]|uniref:Ribonuclease VapC n=1 Tax=Jiella sonneratiae TaxID=2816856 RepID=A0ABS3J5M4_9HYPH|nr:type II toxin-antitoxin system VapC family toxin [Jiella sonneratiae]MBO0904387.1 type II toxin-antitoxin system VapC family toxin [Jiella sonneratiae]